MGDLRRQAHAHATWLTNVCRELLHGDCPTWDQVEFLLTEEFIHGHKHGMEEARTTDPAFRESIATPHPDPQDRS